MPGQSVSPVVRFIRDLVAAPAQELPDEVLLERFVRLRDETAFALLVRRYGRLVLSVCRRVLRHEQDAEDAFQATFLVLVRKARSIAKREAVGSWLYGVAFRVAAKARRTAQRNASRLKTLPEAPVAPKEDPGVHDLKAVLDQELYRLPAKYRAAVVLCYLQGKTTEEAAGQLGCARGTVLSRLARARARLRPRLARRGLALSSATVATLLARAAHAAVPQRLQESILRAALACADGKLAESGISLRVAALSKGVFQTMLWTKLAYALAGLLGFALLGGGVFYGYRACADGPAAAVPAAVSATAAGESPADQLLAKIQEEWKRVEERIRDNHLYTDKVTFAAAYEERKKDLQPSSADLAAVYKQLSKSLDDKKGNAAYLWRCHQVLGAIQLDLKDPKKALDHYQRALEVYPAKTYEEPSKHSYYQHLANETAGIVWEQKGVEEAEKTILKLLADAPQFQYFYSAWWQEKYAAAGQTKRLKPLLQKVLQIYADKAEKDKENGDLYRKYRRELKRELETEPAVEERSAGNSPRKKYFLLQPPGARAGARLPLLLIMPGGNGQAAEFLPFLKQLFAEAGREYLFAVLSAPQWSRQQARQLVWPKENDRLAEAEFTTEDFVKTVFEDLVQAALVDAKRALLFGWSSAGPAVYSTALSKHGPPLAGYYILSSVFKPEPLPPLSAAKTKRFFLQQGKADKVTPLSYAEQAAAALKEHGAVVELDVFPGGHGFGMPHPYDAFRRALRWLETEN
jgi:RNA polymerase sigma factor (sigma-70 family)